MCTDNEMEQLASIMTRPSLHQWLQNSPHNGRGEGSHSLSEWVMAVIGTVWADAGDMPDAVSKWQSYVDLVHILQELGTYQVMFNLNTHGPGDECLMEGMISGVAACPFCLFGSLMALLALYVGHCINNVTTVVASLGEVECQWQRKGVWMVS